MMRQNLSIPEKIAHWLYDGLSRYGESFFRPIVGLFFIIFILVPAIVLYQTINSSESISSVDLKSLYWANVVNTTKAIFQFPGENDYGDWEVVLKLTGILLLGNIFIAVRRRLERK